MPDSNHAMISAEAKPYFDRVHRNGRPNHRAAAFA